MTFGLLTCLHHPPRAVLRRQLSAIVLSHFAGMDLDMVKVASVSMARDQAMARTAGWETARGPNLPVSDKHQRGLARLRGRVDVVVVIGSDDLVLPSYFHHLESVMQTADIARLSGLYLLDATAPRAVWLDCALHNKVGLGRAVSHRLLDRQQWHGWPTGHNTGLDKRALQVLMPRAVKIEKIDARAAVPVDVKTDTGIWPYARAAEAGIARAASSEHILNTYPALRGLMPDG